MSPQEPLFADETPKNKELLFEEETYAVLGAAMEVHSVLGPSFLESVYEAAMIEECKLRSIPIQEQVRMNIIYKGIQRLSTIDEAQLLNYLKATGIRVGLLVNFGNTGKLEHRRFIL